MYDLSQFQSPMQGCVTESLYILSMISQWSFSHTRTTLAKNTRTIPPKQTPQTKLALRCTETDSETQATKDYNLA